jgi:hypothetical protein
MMFSRIRGIPVLMAAAVAVPYLSTNGSERLQQWWNSVSSSSEGANSTSELVLPPGDLNPPPRGPGHEIFPISTPLEGTRSVSLEEVFRFDVTREWVYERWARKSTALAELGSYGIRVPLVTGTQIHDLAGSLTYFFDSAGKVQRISFKGNTGDTTRIVMLAVQRHGMQQQNSQFVGEQVFEVRRGDDVFSELRTRPSSVLWSSSPHESFAVELDLQGPNATTPLPRRLAPVPEVPPVAAKLPEEADAQEKQPGFRESLKAFFPRSRVSDGQVENLERQDFIW